MSEEEFPSSAVPDAARVLGMTQDEYRIINGDSEEYSAEDIAAISRLLSWFLPPKCADCTDVDPIARWIVRGEVKSERVIDAMASHDHSECSGSICDVDAPLPWCPSGLAGTVLSELIIKEH